MVEVAAVEVRIDSAEPVVVVAAAASVEAVADASIHPVVAAAGPAAAGA